MTSLTYVRVLRQVVAFAIGFALAAVTLIAVAAAEHVNADRTGLALRGYDPVAYFTQGRSTAACQQSGAHVGQVIQFPIER